MTAKNVKAKTAKPKANGVSKDPLAIFGFNEGSDRAKVLASSMRASGSPSKSRTLRKWPKETYRLRSALWG